MMLIFEIVVGIIIANVVIGFIISLMAQTETLQDYDIIKPSKSDKAE